MKRFFRLHKVWILLVGISVSLIALLVIPGVLRYREQKASFVSITLPENIYKIQLKPSGQNDSFILFADNKSLLLVSEEGRVLTNLYLPYLASRMINDKSLGIVIEPSGYISGMDATHRKLYKYIVRNNVFIENGVTDLIDTTTLKSHEDVPSSNVKLKNHCFSIDIEYGSCMFKWVTGRINNKNILIFGKSFRSLTINDSHTALLLIDAADGDTEAYIVEPAKQK